MKSTALGLTGRGWSVFPVTVSGKAPIKGSNGLLDASTDPAAIERMWAGSTFANIGINCGLSDLYVIDVDMNPWKDKIGGKTWAALVGEHGHTDTYTVRTWSGGRHFYYRMPPGMALANTSGTGGSTGRGLGVDIDTRGTGGYVLAAGSRVVEDGHEGFYVVEHDLEVADLPRWVIDAVASKPKTGRSPSLAGPLAAEEAVYERVVALSAELAAAPVGEGNDTASKMAYRVGQYVGAGQIGQDEATRLLLDGIAGWSWQNEGDFTAMSNTIIRGVEKGIESPRAWDRPVARSSAGVSPPIGGPEVVPVVPDPFTAAEGEQEADPEEESEQTISMWSTDNGQGVFLRDRVGDVLYAVGVGWMVWDGARWQQVDIAVIQNRVSRFYRKQFEKMLEKYMATLDEKWHVLAKAYKGFMSSARLGSILNHLKVTDGVLVDAADLDTHKHLLNTPKGVVDLRVGTIAPHDRKLLFTKVTRGSYRPHLRHSDWEKALTALDEEERDYLKIRMGQAVTGYIPESDDAIFLVGHGSNGKSSYTSDGVFRAIGDYGALAQATLISKATEGSGPTPERFGLRGCRFVLIEELPEGRSLSIAEVKRITGMSVITARDVHEKQVTFDATHTLFITTNYLPAVAEVDEGSWRRFCCVRFPYRFRSVPESPMDRDGDPGLKSRLREGEDGQHDAIITWLVEGAMTYFADRSVIMEDRRPAGIQQSTLDWRKEADRILAYIDERLDFPEVAAIEQNVARSDLYADFSRFLEERGHAKWSQETFLSRFRSHERIRSHGVTEAQIRNHDTISRPPLPPNVTFSSARPALPTAPRIFRGLNFRQEL
jgi:P4 family phage/plasmid primase-like protien